MIDIHALAGMDRHAASARDIADDLVARQRRAALGKMHLAARQAGHADAHIVLGGGFAALLGRGLRSDARHDGHKRLLMAPLLLAQAGDDVRSRDAAAANSRIEVVEIRKGELAQDRLGILGLHEHGQARRLALRLGFQHGFTGGDVLILELFFIEIADLRLRLRGLDDLEPVAAGALAVLLGDDLDEIARIQLVIQRHDAAIDLRADALIADRAVNAIGKVNRRRAAGQIDNLSLGREDEDFVAEQIHLERGDEFLAVTHVVLPIQNLAQPIELIIQTVRRLLALFIAPVGRDAVFRNAVHLMGTDLHLKGHAVFADDRRMQRLIHVRLGHGDVILEAVGNLLPEGMHDTQHGIAVLHAVHKHAQRDQIVDLLKGLMLQNHLAIDAVKMLRTAVNLKFNAHLGNLVAQRLHEDLDIFLALRALHADLGDQVLIALRIQIAQAQVFQLLLDLVNAHAVSKRRIDIQGLLRNSALAFRFLRLKGAHVVGAVRQLDEHDADVLAHRQDHLADRLSLLFHAGGEIQPLELCNAIHQQRDLLAELLGDHLERHLFAVLHRVVQKACGDRRRIEHQLGEDAGHRQRMEEIRLAGLAHLALMRLLGKMVRLFDHGNVAVRMIFDHNLDQFFQTSAFFLCQAGIPPYGPFMLLSLPRTRLDSRETFPLGIRL